MAWRERGTFRWFNPLPEDLRGSLVDTGASLLFPVPPAQASPADGPDGPPQALLLAAGRGECAHGARLSEAEVYRLSGALHAKALALLASSPDADLHDVIVMVVVDTGLVCERVVPIAAYEQVRT